MLTPPEITMILFGLAVCWFGMKAQSYNQQQAKLQNGKPIQQQDQLASAKNQQLLAQQLTPEGRIRIYEEELARLKTIVEAQEMEKIIAPEKYGPLTERKRIFEEEIAIAQAHKKSEQQIGKSFIVCALAFILFIGWMLTLSGGNNTVSTIGPHHCE